MSYVGYGVSTQTAAERREEANRILKIIDGMSDFPLTSKGQQFLREQRSECEQQLPISPKQLWFLRDIKDQLL